MDDWEHDFRDGGSTSYEWLYFHQVYKSPCHLLNGRSIFINYIYFKIKYQFVDDHNFKTDKKYFTTFLI